MKSLFFWRWMLCFLLFSTSNTLFSASPISAVWTGKINNDWSNKHNWSGSPFFPILPSGNVIFTGTVDRTTINNTGSVSLQSLLFSKNAAEYTINNQQGAAITFRDGASIVNDSGKVQKILNSGTLTFGKFSAPYFPHSFVEIINNAGGVIRFLGETKGNAPVVLVNNSGATLDLSRARSVGFKEISSAGNIILGNTTLALYMGSQPDQNSSMISGVISGPGGLFTVGRNSLILTGENTYTGETEICDASTLQLGDGGTKGSLLSKEIFVSGKLIFNRADDIIFDNKLELWKQGSIIKLGSNTVTLNNMRIPDATESYTKLVIADGTLVVSNGRWVSQLPYLGSIENNGTLIVDIVNPMFIRRSITGSGSLIKKGPGTLSIGWSINTYTGNTIVSDGVLQLPSRSYIGVLGVLPIMHISSGSLKFDDDNVYVGLTSIPPYFGQMMTGASGQNVSTIPGNITVSSPGVLSGGGIIGGEVYNHGTVTPNCWYQNLRVVGNYTQFSDGTYMVHVNADGNSDLLAVHGVATLDGNLVIDTSAGIKPGFRYRILTADGGIVGKFANINAAGQIEYQDNIVFFLSDTDLETMPTIESAVLKKQRSSFMMASVQNLAPMATPVNVTTATYANQQIQLAYTSDIFTQHMIDRLDIYPAIHALSLWILPYGNNAVLDTSASSGLDTTSTGVAMGVDVPVFQDAVIGAGIASTYFTSTAEGGEVGSDDGMLFQLGLYGRYNINHWTIAGTADYGITSDMSGDRDNSAHSSYQATVFSEQLRTSYDISVRQNHIRPFIGLINRQVQRDAFSETGDNATLLTIDQSNYDSLNTQLGTSVDIPLAHGVTFLSSVAWQHELADAGIDEVNVGRESALVKAGFMLLQCKKMALSAMYTGEFAGGYHESGGAIQLNWIL